MRSEQSLQTTCAPPARHLRRRNPTPCVCAPRSVPHRPSCVIHPLFAALMVPSRHLWLGNITQKPTDEQVLEVFATFGKVDSGA